MFGQLDITGRGLIGPDDLQKVLSTSLHKKEPAFGDNNIRRFTDMVKEFDLNGDGYLDPQEFRKMLRAEEPWNEGDSSTAAPAPFPKFSKLHVVQLAMLCPALRSLR
ncbi:unnamed protein product [Symbiodinium sp. KB8]|nr:unnamed protein product [Symbiodinium sp. KB8]